MLITSLDCLRGGWVAMGSHRNAWTQLRNENPYGKDRNNSVKCQPVSITAGKINERHFIAASFKPFSINGM